MTGPVILLTLLSLVAAGTGFLREAVTAYYFGTTAAADAFSVTLFYAESITVVVLFGLAGYMMVPIITRLFGESRPDEGYRLMESLLFWLVLVSLPLIVLGVAKPEWLAQWIAPDFSSTQRTILAQLLRLGLPAILFIVLSGLLSGVLQAQGDYYTPTYGRMIFSLGIAAALVVGARGAGIQTGALGLTLGSFGQFGLQIVSLRRRGWRPHWPRWWHSAMPAAISAGLPALLALLLMNLVAGGGQRLVASSLPEGSLAALNYAQRTLSLISGFTLSLSTISLTELSIQFHAEGTGPETLNSLLAALKSAIFLLLPLSFLLVLTSEQVIVILFQRGAYDVLSLQLTTECLRWFTLSVLPGALFAVLHRAYPAFWRPWRATVISFILTLVTIGATMLLLPSLKLVAVPAAFAIGRVVGGVACVIGLWDVLGARFVAQVIRYLFRITLFCVLALMPALVMKYFTLPALANSWTFLASVVVILATAAVFGGVFLAVCAVGHEAQLDLVWRAYRRFRERLDAVVLSAR